MKTKFLLCMGLLLSGAIFLVSNSSGRANGGNDDRTGSPTAVGTCNNCHSGGAFAPNVVIDIQDSQGSSVTTVMGDSLYDISVTINATSGSPGGYGFQALVMDDVSQESAGALVTAGTGVRFVTLSSGNKEVAEQNSTSSNNSFSFSWRAPSSSAGTSFTIYAIGNCVDGTGGTSGDVAATDDLTVSFSPTVTAVTEPIVADQVSLNLYPNPVAHQLNLSLNASESASYQWHIFSSNGQEIRSNSIDAQAGDNQFEVNVTDLPVGAYRFILQNQQGQVITKPFIKY